MNSYTIRKATTADLETIQKLNHALCVLEKENYDPTIDPESPFSEAGKVYFTSRISSPDTLALVAEVEGKVIGYFIGLIQEKEDYRIIPSLAEAENMYIEEIYRGLGIGKEFMKQFEEWCKANNIARMRVVASVANASAIKFYKSQGLEEYNIVLEKDIIT